MESAHDAIPEAVEIEKTFDNVYHTITHFGFAGEKTNQWNTNAYFDGRYQIHMTVMVKINYSKRTLEKVGEPEFRLFEYSKIYDPYGDGKIYGGSIGRQFEFSIDEWKRVFDNNGDITALEYELLNDSPLINFDKFVEGKRGDNFDSLTGKRTVK